MSTKIKEPFQLDLFQDEVERGMVRLQEIKDMIFSLTEEAQRVMEHVVDVCDHPKDRICELNYRPETHYSYASPPWRICKKCGLTEEGWGSYKHLAPGDYSEFPRISQNDWFKMRTISIERERSND